jgi:multiple sugar transport system substrate-binding protein
VNVDEKLSRHLRDALDPGQGFPGPQLRHRIMADVSARPRRPPAARTYLRRRTWVPALAALVALAVMAEPLIAQRVQAAGRVEFLATTSNGQVEFVSSQAQPAAEYRAMTESVLPGFNGTPDFNSQTTAAQDIARIRYEQSVGRSTVDLVALTPSEMVALQASGGLEDLTPLLRRLQHDRRFPQALLDNGKFGTDKQYFIPWLQATYMMVVNKKALPYLPRGADVNHLTYDQLIAWGQNIEAATGQKLIGLPADLNGPRGGLVYRFLQGYAYPSFTGTTLIGFRSPEAVQMWQTLQRLWSVTNQLSTTYLNMQDPLTTGEVWIAWDHQARLGMALADDQHFLAVPAPTGPRGLGYMSAVVGLAIPKDAQNRQGAEALIEWLTRPRQQAAASASLSFSPVVQGVALSGAPAAESKVANIYQSNRDGRESVPPAGLGSSTDDFTSVYQDTFARIVLHGEDIQTVLNEEAGRLQQLVDSAHARCWSPDPSSRGPCQIR